MSKINNINLEELEGILMGRVEPHIYAFTTRTIPNYLKVGDTYRPIETRLNEWRKYFPNLEKKFQNVAKIDEKTFFRDFSVHFFLENELKRTRLKQGVFQNMPYFSNEFFENATEKDLLDAIEDIKNGHQNNDSRYQYYHFDDSRVPITHTYVRMDNYPLRPNQQKTVDNFQAAIKKGRTNLLMYAVMRFGKSFTSMCCAVAMEAKVVVVVSAKADVKGEWKKTVESHLKFDGYSFLDSEALLKSETIVADKLKENGKIVVFLTLQDLQGSAIKSKHKEIFEHKMDLLLIDETHFGARATEYGKVLKTENLSAKEIKNELKLNDNTLDDLEITKVFDATIRLHLSGTPYRILMNSEFTKEDIIAFYQFSDIADDQKKWDEENLYKDDIKEWDNPYYGFPQMIRFAFNPNASSRKRMEDMKKNGITYAFSELFKPQSIALDKVHNSHKKFKYAQEVLDLLKVIDGSESDDNVLSFLNYDKINNGKMCRHLVCVLPYRASCDALEALIQNNKFLHLNGYEIINISGVDNEKMYKDTLSVQAKIKKCESDDKKTITLTVNRMLTGSTVPEWDTMLYLKDTASPQEYDQAIFRLQNQYVKVLKSENGDVVKYNMKPQTLLVDFNPNRMFQIQEHKSQIYNVNTERNGNSKLAERIAKELKISPIIVVNNNKMVQIQPAQILDAVREYSSSRSVFDEATAIPVDYGLLDIAEIKAEILKQSKIGARQGLEIKNTEGSGDDLETGVSAENLGENNHNTPSKSKDDEAETDYKGKFAMFYARILFFAFLTDSRVKSLEAVIEQIKNADNLRIADNLNLDKNILSSIQKHINPFVLSELDYKIQNINSLANDTNIEPIERASNAMKKFSRLSDSEIVTPEIVADRIINGLPDDAIDAETKILDIAAKQGEFVYAVFKKFGKAVANNFYSIPTSKIAYEFTRKVYKLLELDTNLIEASYTSYDLIQENTFIENENIKINNMNVKVDVILGNPPYQQKEGGANSNTALPIYNHFVGVAKNHNPKYIALIMPTRWYAGGRGLDDFRDEMLNDSRISELHDYLKPEIIFQNVNLRGGICHFLWGKNYDNKKNLIEVFTYKDDLTPSIKKRSLKTQNSDILVRHNIGVAIIEKVSKSSNFKTLASHVSAAKAFGFRTFFINDKRFRSDVTGLKEPITCYGKGNSIGYVDKSEVVSHSEWIDSWKVYIPESNNIGTELNDDNQNSFVGKNGTICTETFLVVGANLLLDEISSKNLSNYLRTKFARFMHSLAKISQHGTSKTYQFVPLQNFTSASDIDWSKATGMIDQQLYAKYKLTAEEIDFIEKMIKPMK